MNRKILSISSKRQITIPQKFYQALGFGSEAECVVRGDELVIRPCNLHRSHQLLFNIVPLTFYLSAF